jgi:hypothetical protein
LSCLSSSKKGKNSCGERTVGKSNTGNTGAVGTISEELRPRFSGAPHFMSWLRVGVDAVFSFVEMLIREINPGASSSSSGKEYPFSPSSGAGAGATSAVATSAVASMYPSFSKKV